VADSTVLELPPGDWANSVGGLATAMALLVTSALYLLQLGDRRHPDNRQHRS
jgi:hypothetical protein